MLVLTVDPQKTLTIGDNIVIQNVGRQHMRIGIQAPRELKILRKDAVRKLPPITEDYDE